MAESSGINLLNKTFDVIELLSNCSREMGVSEISRHLNMVKSGTFRILNTLKERDLVYQNPSNKCYGLGLKFYFIGTSAQAGLPLCTVAKKYLENLSVTYEECFELSIPYSQNLTTPSCLVVSSGSAFSSLKGAQSLLRPLHATSSGKCLLAFSSESEVKAFRGYDLIRYTDTTITSWNVLDNELFEIREQGFCICENEYIDNLCGIAVPVYDSMHSLLGALSISGLNTRLKKINKEDMVRILQRTARNIGRKF